MQESYTRNSLTWEKRAKFSNLKFLLLSVLGGFFIGLGYLIYHIIVANESFGSSRIFIASALFPIGIILCVFFAGTLFTLDTGIFLKFFERKINVKRLLSIWGIVLVGNFIGTFLIALIAFWSQIYESKEMIDLLNKSVAKESGLNWYVSLGSAIICGLLVGVAVWIANSLKNTTSKLLIIWIIITVFVVSGTEHIVANMYIFAIGWVKQLDFSSFNAIFENLIPTAIGNWVAGALIVPGTGFMLNHLSLKENNI